MKITNNVTYRSGQGGLISIDGDTTEATLTGVSGDWVWWNDLHIQSDKDLQVDLTSGDVHSTTKHIAGSSVISFGVESPSSTPHFDVQITGLKPNSWYRLEINGIRKFCDSGVTEGRSNDDGILFFSTIEL